MYGTAYQRYRNNGPSQENLLKLIYISNDTHHIPYVPITIRIIFLLFGSILLSIPFLELYVTRPMVTKLTQLEIIS